MSSKFTISSSQQQHGSSSLDHHLHHSGAHAINTGKGATITNYRQATAKGGDPANHHPLSSMLNKENKALQNLLAAVELNRTHGVGQLGNSDAPSSGKPAPQVARSLAAAASAK